VWAMRDLLAVKHSPACISVVDKGSGQLLWRPAWSCSVSFGFHPCGHHPLGPCGPREWKCVLSMQSPQPLLCIPLSCAFQLDMPAAPFRGSPAGCQGRFHTERHVGKGTSLQLLRRRRLQNHH
jgi:hypothetical protein